MNIGFCRNCRFWEDGRCEAPQSGVIKTRANRPFPAHLELIWETTDPSGFAAEATVSDDTGLTTFLVTGPDFGCVKFKH